MVMQKNSKYHTRNCCWTTINRTNSENSLWLINYWECLLHRNCKFVIR